MFLEGFLFYLYILHTIAAAISYNIPFPGLSAGLKGCEVEACLIFYACHILEATVRQH